MNFGEAIEAMKIGKRVSREGWNDKGMFLYLNKGSAPEQLSGFTTSLYGVSRLLFDLGDRGTSTRMPNINMKAANGETITGWLASQTDMLAEDWGIVE